MIKSAFICFCQAGDDIELFRLIGDYVHPYRINYCDGPISSRAWQLNRDIAEVPRLNDRNVKTEGVAVRAYGVTGWRNGLLAKDFSCVACSKAKYQGKRCAGCKRSGRYTTIYHGASFGEAAFANMSKDKAYLIFL